MGSLPLRTNIVLRVDDELLARIRAAADADDRSVSSYLRRIIEANLPGGNRGRRS